MPEECGLLYDLKPRKVLYQERARRIDVDQWVFWRYLRDPNFQIGKDPIASKVFFGQRARSQFPNVP